MLVLIFLYAPLNWIQILWRNPLFSSPCTIPLKIWYGKGLERGWLYLHTRGIPELGRCLAFPQWRRSMLRMELCCLGLECAVAWPVSARWVCILPHPDFLLTSHADLVQTCRRLSSVIHIHSMGYKMKKIMGGLVHVCILLLIFWHTD